MSDETSRTKALQRRFKSQMDELGFKWQELWKWLDPTGYGVESKISAEIEGVLDGEIRPSALLLEVMDMLLHQSKRLEDENKDLKWHTKSGVCYATIKSVDVYVEPDGHGNWRIRVDRNDPRMVLDISHSNDFDTQLRKAPMYVDRAIEDSIHRGLWSERNPTSDLT